MVGMNAIVLLDHDRFRSDFNVVLSARTMVIYHLCVATVDGVIELGIGRS